MMFGNLREKLHNVVQEGLSASLRGLSGNEVIVAQSPSEHPVNYDAGADLLHKYQTEWNQLHLLAEDNAHKAEEVSEMISLLHHQMSEQWKKMDTITSCMDSMPQLVKSIENAMKDMENIKLLINDVEHQLLKLDDVVEEQELQEQMLNERFQLAVYRSKKLKELEKISGELEADHKEKVTDLEQKINIKLKERQEIFNQVFQQDMRQYIISGMIPVMKSSSNGGRDEVSLEDIEIEDDTDALDELLNF
ncbi:dysbindin protein homolog [Acyrthosiphon pisum]|uniref:ACYPI008236 protein n=1 Tax=Acyrthosiphon pisum TaxID=7029 RepID=C4WVV6_ACYPI|nr:dysbindin protein homolog [Acyrthosiphon pisum]BAH72026.1 ACYPI008236 [Acyrthosiphon pisum]|eukprot:NP_001280263.1 dysbindin protein homolog [Acyrthosiphon pisum]